MPSRPFREFLGPRLLGGAGSLASLANVVKMAVALVGLCLTSACGGERFIVVATVKAPSASGYIEIDDVSDKGTTLTVHLEQLHPVAQLDASMKQYVVWAQAAGQPAARLGVLRYNPDQRVGELHARTPLRSKFVVKVTAESNDAPTAPSELVVASEEIKVDD
jgi:hypothetical protein